VTVFKEGRTISAKDDEFTDSFDGYGTHVYVWDK
jgi:hypothetical protein